MNIKLFSDLKKSKTLLTNNNNTTNEEIVSYLDDIINFDKIFLNTRIEKIFYRDLEFYLNYNGQNENTIFDKLDNTFTLSGKRVLKLMLDNPTYNVRLLLNRQNHIKYMHHLIKKKSIGDILLNLKKVEKDIFWLWKPKEKTVKKMYDLLYFNKNYLNFINCSPILLQIYYYFKLIFSPFFSIISPLSTLIFPYIITKFIYKIPIPFTAYLKLLKAYFLSVGKSYYSMFSLALSIFMYFYNIYIIVELYLKDINLLSNIYNKCINITEFLDLSKKLYNFYEEECNNFNYFSNCNSDIFKFKGSIMTNIGKILNTYQDISHYRDKLIPIINFIGNVDFYYSSAILFDKFKNNICFAEYVKNKDPFLLVKDVYHPSLFNTKCIKNSLTIGYKNPQNAIITGPNAGGKSTFIKSLAISLLLSQTIGISLCKKFVLTPFKVINSYLHIPDDKGTESLFEAQVNRCKNHINILKKLEPNDFSFIIMDEIFNSTSHDEGVASAYAILKNISSYTNSISLITTRYKYLTKLATTDSFKNYYIPVKFDPIDKKKYKYTYKLKNGISNQIITFDVLKKQGLSEEIINLAEKEMLKI